MAFKLDSQDEVLSEINVVPLVDVILVVLIIFMVTAPMIMKPSISVNLPKAASGDATKPSKLSISISANGEFILDGKIATEEIIKSVAAEEMKKNPDTQAVIAADKEVPHGKVVALLDIVKATGIKKFAISIEKK